MPAQSFCFSLTIAVFRIRGSLKCSLAHFANIFVNLKGLSWALQVVQVMTGGRRLVAINAEHQGSGREQVAIDDQALGRWTPHHLYEASLKTLEF